MDDNKLIDGAEIITLDEIKHLMLPYFEGLAAGYPRSRGQVIDLLFLKGKGIWS